MTASARVRWLVALSIASAAAMSVCRAAVSEPATAPIQLHLDATDAPRALFRGRLRIPVDPGPLKLVYPKWIPGEHGPTGPITDLVDLEFSALGEALRWRRDGVDMYAFHLTVPEGADMLDVSFAFLGATTSEGFTSAASSTSNLAIIAWNQFVLYPSGARSDDVMVAAGIERPRGWQSGTALQVRIESGNEVTFNAVSLTTLIDSPVLIGKYFRSVALDDGPRPVTLDIAADGANALAMSQATTQSMKQLVREADAMFGARHFDRYHFLLTLSDHVAHFGLEHHESNDTRLRERTFLDEDLAKRGLWVLSHEYVHSWNAKYRRPAGLATPNPEEPMLGELLWVYEGLTEYLGAVLAARSGLWTPEYYREVLAAKAAHFDHVRGRRWRPLDDTCVAAQLLYAAPGEWELLRRGVDFYDEGWLLWLDVDTRIRELTKGERSLDDFCRRFYGGESGSPRVVTYTFDDVVKTLNDVAPFDWLSYFDAKVMKVALRPPMDGIERGGWRLIYGDKENEYLALREEGDTPSIDAAYSIGLRVDPEGSVQDVVPESPAFQAGVGPGMTVIAVNGRRFSSDVLKDALEASPHSNDPITLLIENKQFISSCAVEYDGGLRIPHLERNEPAVDLLGQTIAPRAKGEVGE